jgi:hypothetical protein
MAALDRFGQRRHRVVLRRRQRLLHQRGHRAGIRIAKPRLALVHLSDTNQQVYRHDAVGLGTVPFEVVPPVLAEIGHRNLPVLEIIAANADTQIEDSARRLVKAGLQKARPAKTWAGGRNGSVSGNRGKRISSGHAVTEALLARGDDVIATDVAINPACKNSPSRIRHLKFTPGEITEWPLLARLLKDGKPDRIVHCAALVGVPASVGSPIGCFRVNIEGTINLLEAMRFFGVRRMVNISSEEIYGPFLSDTIDEDHRCLPTKPYGISKFVVEQVARDYAAAHGLECIHTRTCWVYGPYFPRPRAPRNLLDAAIQGRSVHVPGRRELRGRPGARR